jgi:hypothetical protein
MKTKGERIKALVENPRSPFVEDDVVFLEGLEDCRLTSLEAHAAEPEASVEPEKSEDKDAQVQIEALQKQLEALKTASAKPRTEEEYLSDAPDSVKQIVTSYKMAQAARRAELVGKLKTAQSVYSEAELSALESEHLEKLAKITTASGKADFGPAGGAHKDDENVVPAAPNFRERVLAARKN